MLVILLLQLLFVYTVVLANLTLSRFCPEAPLLKITIKTSVHVLELHKQEHCYFDASVMF